MSKVKKTTKMKATAKKKVTAKAKTTTKATAKKKTTAKPKVKATTKKKVTKKPAVKRATSKFKRGYDVKLINKELTFAGVTDLYEVYEVTGPKVDKKRIFVDEESVLMFIEQNETASGLVKSFESAVKRASTKSERKEMQAAKELSELVPELETIVDANFRDSKAKRPEDTDK